MAKNTIPQTSMYGFNGYSLSLSLSLLISFAPSTEEHLYFCSMFARWLNRKYQMISHRIKDSILMNSHSDFNGYIFDRNQKALINFDGVIFSLSLFFPNSSQPQNGTFQVIPLNCLQL